MRAANLSRVAVLLADRERYILNRDALREARPDFPVIHVSILGTMGHRFKVTGPSVAAMIPMILGVLEERIRDIDAELDELGVTDYDR